VEQGSHAPKFLAYLVVLCFEKRCPKQNTVARLKSKYLSQKKFGLATLLAVAYKLDSALFFSAEQSVHNLKPCLIVLKKLMHDLIKLEKIE